MEVGNYSRDCVPSQSQLRRGLSSIPRQKTAYGGFENCASTWNCKTRNLSVLPRDVMEKIQKNDEKSHPEKRIPYNSCPQLQQIFQPELWNPAALRISTSDESNHPQPLYP
jgi:hypothetical protein